ncbi:hypothetical protein AALO_G00155380 [Alosa alosa]|uniref:Dolichyl-diphosphooligosaccharide-protein glycosyltransferase subunit TMEM258 n=1 Tax=Alosa alosa TaxID=278164 RepID=A0AAV6GLS8_9TELE|nr:hypothetical protein AALO_G00155380 [Alosa alosa]
MELETMTRYTSPVNPAVFPHLTVVLLAIGMFFTAWFFVYEVTSTKYTRDVYKELLISLVASLFMGFGVLFLLLLGPGAGGVVQRSIPAGRVLIPAHTIVLGRATDTGLREGGLCTDMGRGFGFCGHQ